MTITRASRLAFALIALACFAGAAGAQEWPMSHAYKCRWSLTSGGSTTYGESVITFQNLVDVPGQGGLVKSGQLKTEYNNGSQPVIKDITLSWLWALWSYNEFELVVSGGPTCSLVTYQGGEAGQEAVRFDGLRRNPSSANCSNGAFQVCARHNQSLQ